MYVPAVRPPRLKSLIVELQVFAWYIFSICAMLSLPLCMGWVYCDSVSDHTPVSGFCWHFPMFHSLHVRAAFFLSSRSFSTSCWWTLMQDKLLLLKHFSPRRFSKYSKEKLLNFVENVENEPSRNQLTVGVKGDLCTVVQSKCTCGVWPTHLHSFLCKRPWRLRNS